MFISRRRWKEMERRVADLEQKDIQITISPERVKEAFRTAVENASCRFEYELTKNRESGPAILFSTSQKQDSAP